jgi:hypothetical protein
LYYMAMSEIEFKVPLPDGAVANTVGPTEAITAMYPVGLTDPAEIYIGAPRVDANGIQVTAANSVLRFEDLGDGKQAILGNTVTRNCPVADSCGSCALAGAGWSTSEMSDKNCARANTATAFELAEVPPEGRFMLLPVGKRSFVVSDESLTPEYNGGQLLQSKLQAGPSVVFTKTWLEERGLKQFAVGGHGADGSVGVMTTEIDGETLFVPFFSLRQNMGDRGPEDQILRQALTAYCDSMEFDDAKRQEVFRNLKVSISLAASASLENFAHQIQLPREDADAPDREKAYAAQLREQYADLVDQAGGEITSAIVLNEQYPGAMGRGNIYPELEARMGIHVTPITPGNCPGDGQSCHIAYREETEYALTTQLQQMGVPEANIDFDDSGVLDPASPDNKAASNRAEQNNGVEVPSNTNRTLNAVIVSF